MFPNASDACPNDIHGLPVGGSDVRNSSNSFALRWRVLSSEVARLKWFYFDVAWKLGLYTLKKNKKQKKTKKQSQYSVLRTRPSEDGKCHWPVLEN